MGDHKTDPKYAVSKEKFQVLRRAKKDKQRLLKVKRLKVNSCRDFKAKTEVTDKACKR